MTNYDNTNKGVLFINHKKETDRHPDFTGKINVGGSDYYLSAWTNTKKSDGEQYLSINIKPVTEGKPPGATQPQTGILNAAPKPEEPGTKLVEENTEDDIPF